MTKLGSSPPPAAASSSDSPGLSTFGGVYTPSVLTILGVIMYLRFGWVVGNVGLVNTLIIVTLSTSITFLTGLSIAEIATDREVKAGGAYYMISRSLGLEVGGAVGIPLYIAQTLSIALYVIGFAESLAITFPALNQTLVGLITAIIVAGVALKSADFAIRIQYFIMAAIALSLLSLALGHPVAPLSAADLPTELPAEASFWTVFAVFFPAVTGIMSGVALSGDLKQPSRAIPVGTLAAIATGYVIYMAIPLLLVRWADSETLLTDPLVMQRMALWGGAILLGVWGATLSSALGSILGAPRVLQALARDRVLPGALRGLGTGSGPADEPRLGTLVTLMIVLVAVFFGNLNLLAPILTMFFLTTYLVLNIAAGLENFLNSPSFRPTFRVPWVLSFLGAIGCIVVMFLINQLATLLAALIVIGVFVWLKEQALQSTWGDVRRGVWLALVRQGILGLGQAPQADTRNWRPHMLVMSGIPTRRWPMIEFAAALTHNRGLVTVASILPAGARSIEQQLKSEGVIRSYMAERGVQGLVRLVMAADTFEGAEQFVTHYGLGPLVPNTVMLGHSQQAETQQRYCQMVEAFHRAHRNVLIFRENPERGFGQRRRIDLWIRHLPTDGALMMILAYLLQTSMAWNRAEICLKLSVPNQAAAVPALDNLANLLTQLRVKATPAAIVEHTESFETTLQRESQAADLVFLGLNQPGESFTQSFIRQQVKDDQLPTLVYVLAANNFAFLDVLT
ncbi:Na-K-Cl cotransporter [Romeria aff. gracilis LEGE 07310]|uniref:Na-K-Cl cotransporter n=1 Tax=Vasconcelosia minhoensis LEGE 07310 TaxID=915328 RepID=A0A8J7AN94_9CYAN|nr:Na-K-Cl cotransporter [Romeria gracilis]MBE9078150.1 Na-K-Cl cotransporter [Romeria aff. gracilis LEGE 07310]